MSFIPLLRSCFHLGRRETPAIANAAKLKRQILVGSGTVAVYDNPPPAGVVYGPPQPVVDWLGFAAESLALSPPPPPVV
jgi:hypothetical protein